MIKDTAEIEKNVNEALEKEDIERALSCYPAVKQITELQRPLIVQRSELEKLKNFLDGFKSEMNYSEVDALREQDPDHRKKEIETMAKTMQAIKNEIEVENGVKHGCKADASKDRGNQRAFDLHICLGRLAQQLQGGCASYPVVNPSSIEKYFESTSGLIPQYILPFNKLCSFSLKEWIKNYDELSKIKVTGKAELIKKKWLDTYNFVKLKGLVAAFEKGYKDKLK